MANSIITLQSVEKYFGTTCVIPNLTLQVQEGEFITLLGPSGCGKTTLLRMIAGFEQPTKGKVLLEDTDITHKPPHQRNVNTVFQNYALFPHLTVYENIAYGLKQKGVDAAVIQKEVGNVLDMVQMKSFSTRKPRELSGGQQQRIALARAIVNKPKVLLLDEPLAALDLKLRKQMQLELKSLHDHLGLTFIFVTHDQEEALTMSDRIAVMNTGVIEQLDTPENIYNHPATKFVADFIGENNTLTGTLSNHKLTLENGQIIPVQLGEQVSKEALLFIRPEHIRMSVEKTGDSFLLEATVLNKIFLGHFWRVECALKNSSQKITTTLQPESVATFKNGSTVFLSWDITSATISKN